MALNRKDRQPYRLRCREQNPTSQSVIFMGVHISLSRIADKTGYAVSTISKIFAGKRTPSLKAAEAISKALGIGLQSFVSALKQHIESKDRYFETPSPTIIGKLKEDELISD